MKGEEKKFISYIAGAGKRFVIPVYQRNYDWKKEQCKQLFDDLLKIQDEKRESHFFGSIVSVYNPDGDGEEYQIIDGQQRLTTISILLLAIYNILINNRLSSSINRLAEKIYKEYLVDEYQDEDKKIKLKSIKDDQIAFNKLFSSEDEHIKSSNITLNYNYFYEQILKYCQNNYTIDDLYNSIVKLEIIEIKLNLKDGDNPQLIFESLNSTGLLLNEGDKIRNFILMNLPSHLQTLYYDKYWNKIEINTEFDVSAFIRNYLSIKEQKIPAINSTYKSFKEYFSSQKETLENVLSDLLSYSKKYNNLLKGNTFNNNIDSTIYRLNKLETTVARPYLLELLRLWKEEKISTSDLEEIFNIIENYIFRRIICKLPTNALDKIFLTLHNEIISYDNSDEGYKDKLIYTLLNKKGNARFPTDKEFITSFANEDVYNLSGKNKTYIFERLENFETNETKDIYQRMSDGKLTIEHIMPRKLTLAWRKDLGEKADEIHITWLHKLSNLTLSGYNSKYSNSTFNEKKTIKDGFLDSSLRLNQYIAKFDKWTEHELENRNSYLMKMIIKIWPLPKTLYHPKEKQLDTFTLEDTFDPTNLSIVKYKFNDSIQDVSSWVEMYTQVLQTLHLQDSAILYKAATDPNDEYGLSKYIKLSDQNTKKYFKLDDNLYVYVKADNYFKLSLLRKFFQLFNVNHDELTLYIDMQNE